MAWINILLGIPLGYIMYACFRLTGSYGWSILLFAFLAKVVMFPISLSSQKNSIKMVKLQPLLEDIKQRYEGNPELVAQEQQKLYKQEKYSPMLGCLPMLLQLPLILGLIQVIYNPLQHLLHLDAGAIALLTGRAAELLGAADLGYGAQLQTIHVFQAGQQAFEALGPAIQGYPQVAQSILGLNLQFWGLDLSAIPSLAQLTPESWIPLLSGLSALFLCLVQNKYNVLQKNQGALNKWGTTLFLVAFSLYFSFVVPAGIGVYWIVGNLLSVVVLAIVNALYNPRKLINDENKSEKAPVTARERRALREAKAENRKLGKENAKRFYAANKKLVFFSENRGYYKYFEKIIDQLLLHSDVVIHYVTLDPADPVLKRESERFQAYFIDDRTVIPLMMKMDADVVVMTMPDLEQYHIKRSLIRKDIEYVYLHHAMTSFHLVLRKGALDHFDTVFCNGPNHVEEIRQMERVYGLPEKKLVEVGYPLLDLLLEQVQGMKLQKSEIPQILIGPSWQKDNLLEYCLEPLLEALFEGEYRIILRPHPEFIKRFPGKMKAIFDRYGHRLGDRFQIETDFSANETVYASDLVITDWSSIAQEFSYATKKPSLFINTPMKIMNPEYKQIPVAPLDISMREEIGLSVDVENLESLRETVDKLLGEQAAYQEKITQVLQRNIYHIGHSAEVGSQYLLSSLREKQAAQESQSTPLIQNKGEMSHEP